MFLKNILMKAKILALALLFGGVAAAQNPYIQIDGVVENANGIVISNPQSVVAVDITVERDVTVCGPYARYAQKLLGVGATLADKTVWSVKGAEVGLVDGDLYAMPAEVDAPQTRTVMYASSDDGFARLQPDKGDFAMHALEEAASSAASTIFALRRHRMELITGEAGENVFGEGLKAALAEIDRMEQSYLELFYGKRMVTEFTERFVVYPEKSKKQYIVCRFSAAAGLLPAGDLSGDIVLLQIDPSGEKVAEHMEAEVKETNYLTCRIADPATCSVRLGRQVLTQRILPIFEFGRTANLTVQRRR